MLNNNIGKKILSALLCIRNIRISLLCYNFVFHVRIHLSSLLMQPKQCFFMHVVVHLIIRIKTSQYILSKESFHMSYIILRKILLTFGLMIMINGCRQREFKRNKANYKEPSCFKMPRLCSKNFSGTFWINCTSASSLTLCTAASVSIAWLAGWLCETTLHWV